jgi:hypothetical protein
VFSPIFCFKNRLKVCSAFCIKKSKKKGQNSQSVRSNRASGRSDRPNQLARVNFPEPGVLFFFPCVALAPDRNFPRSTIPGSHLRALDRLTRAAPARAAACLRSAHGPLPCSASTRARRGRLLALSGSRAPILARTHARSRARPR